MNKLYKKYLEDKELILPEFIVLPAILTIYNVYKKYYSESARYCIAKGKIRGREKEVCMLKYKIISLKHAKRELDSYKSICKRFSTNVTKCLEAVEKQKSNLDKKIKKAKQRSKELAVEHG